MKYVLFNRAAARFGASTGQLLQSKQYPSGCHKKPTRTAAEPYYGPSTTGVFTVTEIKCYARILFKTELLLDQIL
jgi:hypothetical protein